MSANVKVLQVDMSANVKVLQVEIWLVTLDSRQ
jgi:hypothetical protein